MARALRDFCTTIGLLVVIGGMVARAAEEAKPPSADQPQEMSAGETPADAPTESPAPAAQPPAGAPEATAAPDAPAAPAAAEARSDQQVPVTLFMLVQVKTDVPAEQIKRTFEEGKARSRCQFTSLEMKPISPMLYEQFGSLTADFLSAPDAGEEGRSKSSIAVRQLPSRGSLWEIRLEDGTKVLKELEITYRKSGPKKYVPMGPKDVGRAPLVMIVPGSYALRLEPDDYPASYRTVVADLNAPTGDDVVRSEPWPVAENRCFLITLKNFQGDRQRLFEVIREQPPGTPNLVSNPLSDVQLGQDLVFVFASLGSQLPQAGEVIDENRYVPNVGPPGTRTPTRVWMFFPLRAESAQKYIDEYRKYSVADLPQKIRESSPVFADAAEDIVISESSEPRWIELPEQNGRFSRTLKLDDFRKLQAKFPHVKRLLVWEFEIPADPSGSQSAIVSAIEVDHPSGQGRGYVVDEEVKAWPKIAGQLDGTPGKAGAKPDAPSAKPNAAATPSQPDPKETPTEATKKADQPPKEQKPPSSGEAKETAGAKKS